MLTEILQQFSDASQLGPEALRPGGSVSGAAAHFNGPVHLSLGVPLSGRLPLVVELLAFGQTDLQLDTGALKIDGQRYLCLAVLLDFGEVL